MSAGVAVGVLEGVGVLVGRASAVWPIAATELATISGVWLGVSVIVGVPVGPDSVGASAGVAVSVIPAPTTTGIVGGLASTWPLPRLLKKIIPPMIRTAIAPIAP